MHTVQPVYFSVPIRCNQGRMEARLAEMKYSVIIPTLNESGQIRKCISAIPLEKHEIEIIISDGGSTDETIHNATLSGAFITHSSAGRGCQLNRGASNSSGEVLLFLHADTLLPEGAFELLDVQFKDPAIEIGTFRLSFDWDHWLLRLYAWFTRFDTVLTRYGDQCIVTRRTFFERIGGFPEWPLFEDVGLLQKARRMTTIRSFPATVTTSARRFKYGGIVRNQLFNIWLVLQFHRGVSPYRLAEKYQAYKQPPNLPADYQGDGPEFSRN